MSDPMEEFCEHRSGCPALFMQSGKCNCGCTEAWEHYRTVVAERDRYEVALNEIANNHNCDPRAEAREALEGKP